MPDSERQARTPRIMRFPQPQDPDGRPCLPTNHPRSQPPWPTSPTPTPSKTVNSRTCWPTSPASPTRERPVAGATRWSPSWAWPPPRCWPAPGRSPRSPNGLPMRLSPSGPRWALAATSPATSPSPPRPPSAGPFPAWTSTRSPLLSAPGWPPGTGAPVPVGAGRRRAVAVDGKTLRGAHPPDGDGRPVHLLAAMDHTSRAVLAQHQVGGAPEVPAFAPLLAPLDLADVVVTADALQTHPEAAWVPGHQQAGALPIRGQGQPAHPAGPLPAPCLAPGPRAGPHPRLRPRPHRDPHPQGRLGPPFRVPPRRPSPPGHPQDPRPAPPSRRFTTVTVYAITSLTHAQAGPARLADLIRGTGRSRRCTTSATPPSPRTAPKSARRHPKRHGDPAQPGHRRAQ